MYTVGSIIMTDNVVLFDGSVWLVGHRNAVDNAVHTVELKV